MRPDLIPAQPLEDAARRATSVLGEGGTVVLPTDTVYGLAASPSLDAATATLFALKGRDDDVPIAVLCASVDQALACAQGVSDVAIALAERHWPGPLTLVLDRRPDLGWNLGEPSTTIGLRCPDSPLIRAIAEVVGPIATTSANRHGLPTPDSAIRAADSLAGTPDLIVDGGPLAGCASTVVDATGAAPRTLRAGPIIVER